MLIRPEESGDLSAIRRVHESAFPTPMEARLVDLLRQRGKAALSLVAELDTSVVGHILFSPVTLGSQPDCGALGLAPVAVLPEFQRRGIGSRLIREGLGICRERGCPWVAVLGEPDYYRRFGFQRASDFGLENEYGVDEPFMVLPLRSGGLPLSGGCVCYATEFREAGDSGA